MSNDPAIMTTRPGLAWELTRYDITPGTADDIETSSEFYRDPFAALARLAAGVRDSWSLLAGIPGIPVTPPDDNAHAVNLYFIAGVRAGRVHTTYGISYAWEDRHQVGPVDEDTTAPRPDGKHILADHYGEWLCLCGNVSSSQGFTACTPEGVPCEPFAHSWTGGHYVCFRCGRIIGEYGAVTGHVDPASL